MTAIAWTETVYGQDARDRRAEALTPGIEGARAAVETFYHSFNQRSIEVFDAVWAHSDLIALNNPLGGILRGLPEIRALYQRIYDGPADVWVKLHDIVEYATAEMVVFAGREQGEFSREGRTVPLNIRTSRVFAWMGPEAGWRQVHHHGSIDEAEALATYQRAVRGQ